MNKKVTKTEVFTKTDEDGVITEQHQHQTFLTDAEPNYVKIYIQDIGRLNDLQQSQNKILLAFIQSMGYSNIIPAYKPIKSKLAHDLGISLHTVNKAIDTFKKKGLFISVARGMYIADPELFGRGKWSDIKSLRLTIDYNQDGTKQLKSNIPEQMQLKLGL